MWNWSSKDTRQTLVLGAAAIVIIGGLVVILVGLGIARNGLDQLAFSILPESRQAALGQILVGTVVAGIPVLVGLVVGWWLLTHRIPPDGPDG